MANVIDKITNKQLNPNVPEFRVGDTVRVDVKIIEGNKERIQAFEGVVVARKNGGVSETFTVRKVSAGVGVERIFPIHSPKLANITVVRKGKVRRAKLTFLKNKVGPCTITVVTINCFINNTTIIITIYGINSLNQFLFFIISSCKRKNKDECLIYLFFL